MINMKFKILTLILIIISLTSFSQTYNSNYSKIYLYDSLSNEYIISETLTDSVQIIVDTLYNELIFTQKISEQPLTLNRCFFIKNMCFYKEENVYCFFVKELNRDYIIYFMPDDSNFSIVLEKEYTISYYF